MYYADKLDSLRDVFGVQGVALEPGAVLVGGKRYPILDDVIILTEPSQYTPYVRGRLAGTPSPYPRPQGSEGKEDPTEFAADIQATFGAEWTSYSQILPEHKTEFLKYFDLVEPGALAGKRVCDLGCGSGRWAFFAKDLCREMMLVDFSDAIFVARKNLAASNALFFMGDLKRLPFRGDFADFLYCLGVLHHLPTPCLDEVRALKRAAPELLIYLYYALDNRPFYFRMILSAVTAARRVLSGIESPGFRKAFSVAGTYGLYMPLVLAGEALHPVGLSSQVPLYDGYHDKTTERIEQDVYDRFFTRIEQRVSRQEILGLKDTFSAVMVAEQQPYWHFICRR